MMLLFIINHKKIGSVIYANLGHSKRLLIFIIKKLIL